MPNYHIRGTMEVEQRQSARILPWVYVAMLYVTPIYAYIASAIVADSSSSSAGDICWVIGIIIYIATFALGIVNGVMAWVNCKSDREDYLRGCVAILKYTTIPLYVGCAILIGLGFILFLFGGILSVILGVIFQLGVFLVGLCYTWSYLIVSVGNGRIIKGKAILHGVLLSIYVVDVIDTIVIMLKQKRCVVPSIITIIGCVAGILWFLFSEIIH